LFYYRPLFLIPFALYSRIYLEEEDFRNSTVKIGEKEATYNDYLEFFEALVFDLVRNRNANKEKVNADEADFINRNKVQIDNARSRRQKKIDQLRQSDRGDGETDALSQDAFDSSLYLRSTGTAASAGRPSRLNLPPLPRHLNGEGGKQKQWAMRREALKKKVVQLPPRERTFFESLERQWLERVAGREHNAHLNRNRNEARSSLFVGTTRIASVFAPSKTSEMRRATTEDTSITAVAGDVDMTPYS
jgi:hypothetical protein